jgi:hypothetical protein
MTTILHRLGVTALLLTGLALAGCGSPAENMADEMCDCLKENGPMGCMSLTQEHMQELGSDSGALTTYRQNIAQCK